MRKVAPFLLRERKDYQTLMSQSAHDDTASNEGPDP
jgi:hypothetical protein